MAPIVFGVHAVREALEQRGRQVRELWVARGSRGGNIEAIIEAARAQGVKIRLHPRRRLDAKTGTHSHQGVLAFIEPYSFVLLEDLLEKIPPGEPSLLVALDSIQDPQNLGALVRSAYVSGAHGILLPKDRATPLTPAVAKAACGALEHLPVARVTNLGRSLGLLQERNIWVVGLTMEADIPIFNLDLRDHTCLVLGGEHGGLRPLIKRQCDLLACIPQQVEFDSLGVAAAGAMALYEVMRQRRQGRT